MLGNFIKRDLTITLCFSPLLLPLLPQAVVVEAQKHLLLYIRCLHLTVGYATSIKVLDFLQLPRAQILAWGRIPKRPGIVSYFKEKIINMFIFLSLIEIFNCLTTSILLFFLIIGPYFLAGDKIKILPSSPFIARYCIGLSSGQWEESIGVGVTVRKCHLKNWPLPSSFTLLPTVQKADLMAGA